MYLWKFRPSPYRDWGWSQYANNLARILCEVTVYPLCIEFWCCPNLAAGLVFLFSFFFVRLNKNNCLVLIPHPLLLSPRQFADSIHFWKLQQEYSKVSRHCHSTIINITCNHKFGLLHFSQSETPLLHPFCRSPDTGFRILHPFYRGTEKFVLKIKYFPDWQTWPSWPYGTRHKQLFLSSLMFSHRREILGNCSSVFFLHIPQSLNFQRYMIHF